MGRRILGGWLLGLVGLALLTGCSSKPTTKAPGKFRIAVIPKGTTHDFWRSIHAGALEAARERGNAEIRWDGPAKEDQRQEQQQIVERFASEQVSAIVLAPCDRQTLVAPVEAAMKKGIPVVIIDSGLELPAAARSGDKYLGYIATNNHQGGVEAAHRMIELVKDKDKPEVLMIRYQAGSESTEQREAGFRETMRTAPKIHFTEAADEAGATVDSAQKVAERLLSDRKKLDGIFAPNESSTVGVLRALEVLKRAGKVNLVGFDASPILMGALAQGKLQGLVLQDPFDMGYQAVWRAIDHLEGKPMPLERTRYTSLSVATKENMNEPEIRQLHARDLKKYLGD
jgi:ribose transport system substrate-binding protein